MDQYLPINKIDPTKVVTYEKWFDDPEDENIEYQIRNIGLLADDENMYHKYCDYNKFTCEMYPIHNKEDGWATNMDIIREDYDKEYGKSNKYTFEQYEENRSKYFHEWVLKHVCDPTAKIFTPDDEQNFDDENKFSEYEFSDIYETLDNYSVGFFVLIGKRINDQKDVVLVYGRTNDLLPKEYSINDEKIFNKLIKTYYPMEIFIGKSEKNEMTEFSGGYGDKYDGNSILLRIESDNTNDSYKYSYIGHNVFEFTTNEPIIKYVSSVGNNCVPYPYAESLNWCYCIMCGKTPVNEHKKREEEGNIAYVKEATYIKLDNMEIIAERDTDNIKYPVSSKESRSFIRFKKFTQVNIVPDSCNIYDDK